MLSGTPALISRTANPHSPAGVYQVLDGLGSADRQMAQRLYEAVDRLDDDRKHVVHLHYYQGLSIRQTAKVLNVATSTVKYRLREVLKILRIKLDVQKTGARPEQTIPIAEGESL